MNDSTIFDHLAVFYLMNIWQTNLSDSFDIRKFKFNLHHTTFHSPARGDLCLSVSGMRQHSQYKIHSLETQHLSPEI